jgi:surface polysaccharide O-acyltransferase-like enzyme
MIVAGPQLSASENSGRTFAPDAVRAAAMILVVLLHASMRTEGLTSVGWWTSTTLHTFSRIGVPLFFLLSGWLLLNSASTSLKGIFFARRAGKILIPLIAWSAVGIVWRITMHAEKPPEWSALPVLLLNGSAYYHLWFFPVIFKLSLLAPVLVWLKTTLGLQRYVVALAVLALLGAGVFSIAPGYLRSTSLPYLAGYGGYFVLGGLIGGTRLTSLTRSFAWMAVLLGWSLTLLGTGWTSHEPASRSDLFLGFLTLNVAASSIGFFLLIVDRSLATGTTAARGSFRSLVHACGTCSLGIYVMHPFVLEICWLGKLGPWATGDGWPALLAITFHFLLAIAVCGAATAALRSVRWLRVLTP